MKSQPNQALQQTACRSRYARPVAPAAERTRGLKSAAKLNERWQNAPPANETGARAHTRRARRYPAGDRLLQRAEAGP